MPLVRLLSHCFFEEFFPFIVLENTGAGISSFNLVFFTCDVLQDLLKKSVTRFLTNVSYKYMSLKNGLMVRKHCIVFCD